MRSKSALLNLSDSLVIWPALLFLMLAVASTIGRCGGYWMCKGWKRIKNCPAATLPRSLVFGVQSCSLSVGDGVSQNLSQEWLKLCFSHHFRAHFCEELNWHLMNLVQASLYLSGSDVWICQGYSWYSCSWLYWTTGYSVLSVALDSSFTCIFTM